MKKILLASIFAVGISAFLTVSDLNAQTPAKAAEKTVKSETGWMTDFAAAQKLAKETKKPMLVDFTGSDWCPWCIRLDKEVFAQKAFQDYAAGTLILVKIDFPRGIQQSDAIKKQNQELAEKYGIRGFPTVLLMNGDGKVIGTTGYRRGGAESYVAHLKTLVK